jgi:glycerol-3-phosphate acyltransferase PlsY
MLVNVAFIAGSYLFGTLPFTATLAEASGLDLSQERDLHIALQRKVGKVRASLASFVDFIKGSIPLLIGFGFNLPITVVVLSGVAAVAGQMWPPFRNCHGEKGNSTGTAVIITLALIYEAYIILICLTFFAVGSGLRLITYRRFPEPTHPVALALPVGMFLGFAAALIASWCSGQPKSITLGLLALFIIIVARRLTAYLKADLKTDSSVARILVNRLFFDQSFLEKTGK